METQPMGKVLVTAKMENMEDVYAVKLGTLAPEKVRTVEVTDAIVDTGATMLSLPKRLIEQLGLERLRTRRARTTTGMAEFGRLPSGGQVVDNFDGLEHFVRWPRKSELLGRSIVSVGEGPQSSINERATHCLPDTCFQIPAEQLMIRRQLSYLRRKRSTGTSETSCGESVRHCPWKCGSSRRSAGRWQLVDN